MNPLLILLPLPILMAVAACVIRTPYLLTRIAATLIWMQLFLVSANWLPQLFNTDVSYYHGFRIDTTAACFIVLTTVVFAFALLHAVLFFDRECAGDHAPSPRSVSQIYIFLPFFLLAMYAVVSANNLGYMWVAMEGSTLLSAPLVYYYRTRTSLEATWKYLIICSVGIAFSFFGTALIFAASQSVASLGDGSLSLSVLCAHAKELPHGQLRLGFMFMLLGYGVKAGLFPLHSWLPDAHSEAPAPASAILSGALLNCALVALWRTCGLMTAAGQSLLILHTLLPMGVLTVFAAALFLIKQRDIKRLLAYSSMENVGLMATAIALGSSSGFALQAINHSFVKVALFLMAGNLLQQFNTKKIRGIHGLLKSDPLQGMLLMGLAIAIAGTPPFGSFLAEWQILTTAINGKHISVVIVLLAALALAFITIVIHISGMLFGKPGRLKMEQPYKPASISLSVAPMVLMIGTLLLGLALTPTLLALAGGLTQ